tara:strand:+ start:1307 stop:1999 length:693 start_codon:yes stop_codon:yes gene_type:complete
MNEKDKELIFAFHENELNSKDDEYVKNLLSSNNDAKIFLEKLSSADETLDAYFSYIEKPEVSESYSQFIKKKIEAINFLDKTSKTEKYNFISQIVSFFQYKPVLQYGLSFALLLSLTTNFYFFNQDNEEISGFNNLVFESTIEKPFKAASARNSINQIEKEVEKIIPQMINEKNLLGKLIIDNQIIDIKLSSKSFSAMDLECFSGNYFFNSNKKTFNFCQSSDSQSIIFN